MFKKVLSRRTTRAVCAFAALVGVLSLLPAAATEPVATPFSPTGRYANGALLPNGRIVNPTGTIVTAGDFPVAIAVSPHDDVAVVTNSGQGEGSNPDQGN